MVMANPISQDTSSEERRENGLSLILVGFMLWFFDLLILFFMPAGVRLGHARPFEVLMVSVFVAGAVVMAIGRYWRKR